MQARERLINSNLRLVQKLASNLFSKTNSTYNITFTDLVLAGNEGLIHGVDQFDPTRFSTRLSTYVAFYIEKCLYKFVDEHSTIRIPKHVSIRVRALKRATSLFIKLHERSPSRKELSEILDIDEKSIFEMMDAQFEMVSLGEKLATHGDTKVEDLLATDDTPPDNVITSLQVHMVLADAMNAFKKEDREFLLGYFDSETHAETRAFREKYSISCPQSAHAKMTRLRERLLVYLARRGVTSTDCLL